MDRVLQNAPATLTATFDADPGVTTVTVTRDDGTQLTTGAASGTGTTRTFPLTAGQTAQLDSLTVTWATANQGTQTTVVEVVGGFMFTIAEARAMSNALASTNTYPDSRIAAMRTTVEQAIENELGYALVPRYSRSTLTGDGTTLLRLKPYLRLIRWATSTTAGTLTSLAPADISALSLNSAGFITGGYTWTKNALVTVGFEHGMPSPPEPLKMAARTLAKVWLTSGPIDDRTNTFTSTEGGTFSLVTPGRGGSVFGVPSVDAIVDSNRLIAVA